MWCQSSTSVTQSRDQTAALRGGAVEETGAYRPAAQRDLVAGCGNVHQRFSTQCRPVSQQIAQGQRIPEPCYKLLGFVVLCCYSLFLPLVQCYILLSIVYD